MIKTASLFLLLLSFSLSALAQEPDRLLQPCPNPLWFARCGGLGNICISGEDGCQSAGDSCFTCYLAFLPQDQKSKIAVDARADRFRRAFIGIEGCLIVNPGDALGADGFQANDLIMRVGDIAIRNCQQLKKVIGKTKRPFSIMRYRIGEGVETTEIK